MIDTSHIALSVLDEPKVQLPKVFESFGFDPAGPWQTAEVILVATSLGYDLDGQGLRYLLGRGAVTTPKKFGNSLAWRPADVASLIQYLDAARKWLPGYFADRKTDMELEKDAAELNQGLRAIDGYREMSIEELESAHSQMCEGPFRAVIGLILDARKSGNWQ